MNKYLFIISILIVNILACQSDKPTYLDDIPGYAEYVYIPHNIESISVTDTLKPGLWYTTEKAEIFLKRPTGLALVGERYWVSDPLTGSIYSVNAMGDHWVTIATEGHGPGEVLHPAVIFSDSEDSSIVYVLDTTSKSVITYSTEGIELGRFHSSWILGEFYHSNVIQSGLNHFLLTISNHETSVLGIIDGNGELIEPLIPKVIPSGYQPVTHNRVTFDYDVEKNILVFAYKGIPVIFIRRNEKKYLINLMSHKALHELNTPLDVQPLQTRVSVRPLVRNVFIRDNILLVHYNNSLIIYNLRSNEIMRRYEFKDIDDEPLGIHEMRLAGDFLFLMNSFTAAIYKVKLSDVIG